MSDAKNAAATKKGKGNALRIVLISVLVVAIAALVLDRRARSGCTDVYERLRAMIPAEGAANEGEESPTQTEIRNVIGREPDNVYQLSNGNVVEQYIWTGTAHEYSIFTYISPGIGENDSVNAVTMNQVDEKIDLESATLLEDKSIGAGLTPSQPPARNDDDAAAEDDASANDEPADEAAADADATDADATDADAADADAADDEESAPPEAGADSQEDETHASE